MPIAEVQMPDGRIAEFEVPEGTTPEEVIAFAEQQGIGATEPAQPQTARQDAADVLGLDPNIVERGTLLPFGVTKEGGMEFAVPEIALDVARAAILPGQALKGVPVSEEDLLNLALTTTPAALRGAGVVRKGVVDPTQAERAARLQEQGIPATKGDITQTLAQQADEQRLISTAASEAAEPVRQLKFEQSEAFIRSAEDLVDSLGVPARTGESVKAALTGRKELLKKEKNALYKEVADAAPEVADLPVFTSEIEKAIPDAKSLRRLRRLSPNTVDAVDDLLIEFGITKNPEAVAAFTKTGGEITPLSIRNSEEFRQALGQIDKADITGATKVVTGPLRRALDEEAAFIDDAVRESGLTNESILGTLKEARGRVRTIKTEFSPQAITGRLIDVKRDGVTPIIEASKVTQQLLRPTASIEDLRRTLQSLGDSGASGKRAIQDLQASVVMDALEAALKAPSRKTGGIETIGGNQFATALSKFGDDKLNLLFRGNEKSLNALQNLKQTALDITPTAGAVPRGSAPVILDLVRRAGRLPGLEQTLGAISFVAKIGGDAKAARLALDAKPEIKQTLIGIRRDFPTIAERLGLITLLGEQENG